jgi:hypothetical protein
VFRTRERDDEGREAVKRPPDDVGFADRVVQVRVVRHGFQGNPIGIFGGALLPVHAGDQANDPLDRAGHPKPGHPGASGTLRLA